MPSKHGGRLKPNSNAVRSHDASGGSDEASTVSVAARFRSAVPRLTHRLVPTRIHTTKAALDEAPALRVPPPWQVPLRGVGSGDFQLERASRAP